MRYSSALVAALAAGASATAPMQERADKLFTLEFGPGDVRVVTEDEKFKLRDEGAHFFDITEFPEPPVSARLAAANPFPSKVHHKCAVEELHAKINLKKIEEQLVTFSSFHNRYFNSQYGVDAVDWLYAQIREAIKESGNPLATVRYVRHTAWAQPSLIVSLPGIIRSDTVVLGAHLDSVISNDRGAGRAPGADDNGSGSLMLLDTLRVLLSDPRLAEGDHRNTIEWHWYGAEESGLLGSQDIFTQYRGLGMVVRGMLNQDMVGYKGRDGVERFGLVNDFTDPSQNEFMKILIDEYTDIPYEETTCGYACSDHASANRNGYPSSFIFETPFGNHNPYIHTPNDTIEHVDFDHVFQHAKLATGYLYELAHFNFAAPV
ncbi:bacterial leucyl aminopeptidase [Plectosphaerella cucumerina]|uniref:Peptide hydrolase n=1 Tax=Plectosphaerella cucumerina TaxID=40658 RepID=A0A8K0X2R8_9PEZI|nr:bacterial leucyl aminopeptidase [Plectosphaerella cucumerina]